MSFSLGRPLFVETNGDDLHVWVFSYGMHLFLGRGEGPRLWFEKE